jgi:hypothetical protein
MNQDETVAVAVLLGMKQSVVQSHAKGEVQSNIGGVHEHRILLAPASNANSLTKTSKRSKKKNLNDKRSRSDRFTECSQSELSHKIAVKSAIRAKKTKLISPVSVMDTVCEHSSKDMTNMRSASLLPMLTDKLESSDRTLMSILSPKTTTTHSLYPTSHKDVPVSVPEQAMSHINTQFWCQQDKEHQGSQLLTQDIVSALLNAEIQKMTALVNAQQKELQSANHVQNCILLNQSPIISGLTSSSSQSVQPLCQYQVPTSGGNGGIGSVLTPAWADSKDFTAAGLRNDCHTNQMDGITNALLFNLLQQAITSSSFI